MEGTKGHSGAIWRQNARGGADGGWQMADGRWQMADGRWQMAEGQGDGRGWSAMVQRA